MRRFCGGIERGRDFRIGPRSKCRACRWTISGWTFKPLSRVPCGQEVASRRTAKPRRPRPRISLLNHVTAESLPAGYVSPRLSMINGSRYRRGITSSAVVVSSISRNKNFLRLREFDRPKALSLLADRCDANKPVVTLTRRIIRTFRIDFVPLSFAALPRLPVPLEKVDCGGGLLLSDHLSVR